MKDGTAVQLLVNEERGHGDKLVKLLKQAKRLECLVAFAKASGMKGLLKPLREALERGLEARFAVGLDFYLTEPVVLRKLLELSKRHAIKLYLSDASETFHPKIYAFRHSKGCSVIVGSANFTHGGLHGNYEASALVEGTSDTLMASITQHFDGLIDDEILVPATRGRIDAYERAYVIHDILRKVAKKRAQKASSAIGLNFATLAGILELMKGDDSEHGFTEQKTLRKSNLRRAKRMLEEWAVARGDTSRGFLARFEALISLLHSGGLHRGKNRIAEHPDQLVAAMRDIVGQRTLPPGDAFAVLHAHFEHIPRAGINLLTEILHALDNKRFAVMNQNAVSGLALAGIREYPAHPSKQNVDADDYARYCQHAHEVRRTLGLADFTELDALFNYAYWGESAGEVRTD